MLSFFVAFLALDLRKPLVNCFITAGVRTCARTGNSYYSAKIKGHLKCSSSQSVSLYTDAKNGNRKMKANKISRPIANCPVLGE